MGCVMLQIAVLIAYGWESKQVGKFGQERINVPAARRRFVREDYEQDSSFHNGGGAIPARLRSILVKDGSPVLVDLSGNFNGNACRGS